MASKAFSSGQIIVCLNTTTDKNVLVPRQVDFKVSEIFFVEKELGYMKSFLKLLSMHIQGIQVQ